MRIQWIAARLGVALLACVAGSRADGQVPILHPTPDNLNVPVRYTLYRANRTSANAELQRFASALATARRGATFGKEDGAEAELIGAVAAAAVDGLGRVVVLDRAYQTLRVFD